MGEYYRHLVAEECAGIMLMVMAGLSVRAIARTLNRHPSTISRSALSRQIAL